MSARMASANVSIMLAQNADPANSRRLVAAGTRLASGLPSGVYAVVVPDERLSGPA
ncbi:MAG: hypothetical protein ABI912_02670 [Actinomycetota bacterium]